MLENLETLCFWNNDTLACGFQCTVHQMGSSVKSCEICELQAFAFVYSPSVSADGMIKTHHSKKISASLKSVFEPATVGVVKPDL